MITIRSRVLLFALYFSLNAWCQAPPKSAPAASQPAPGAFVDVETGKLYYEECGTGPTRLFSSMMALLTRQYGTTSGALFANGSTPYATTAADMAVLLLQPPGIRKRKISPRSSAIEK